MDFFGSNSKSPVQVENPYSDYIAQTQSFQYRDLRKSLYGFFRSNSKSPVQGFWKIPIEIFSLKFKVIPIGILEKIPIGTFREKLKVSSTGALWKCSVKRKR